MWLFHFQSPRFEQIYVNENCKRAIDNWLQSWIPFKYEIEGWMLGIIHNDAVKIILANFGVSKEKPC